MLTPSPEQNYQPPQYEVPVERAAPTESLRADFVSAFDNRLENQDFFASERFQNYLAYLDSHFGTYIHAQALKRLITQPELSAEEREWLNVVAQSFAEFNTSEPTVN